MKLSREVVRSSSVRRYTPTVNRFGTVREAKEYLAGRILAQADRDGVPLSDVERKMLYFSETGWTLPEIMRVSAEFDRDYNQDEYETKIGEIVRRLYDQPDSDGSAWDEAVQRVSDEDHYLLVLIRGANSGTGKRPRGDLFKLILAGAAVVAVFLPASIFIDSHIASHAVSRLAIEALFLGLAALAAFLASWQRRRTDYRKS